MSTTQRAQSKRPQSAVADRIEPRTEPAKTKSTQAAGKATMQRGPAHTTRDTAVATPQPQGRPVTKLSLIDAFCIAPERKAAEWFLEAGGKIEPQVTLDDGLCETGNRLYHLLSSQPRYKSFIEALWAPEKLASYNPPAELIDTTVVQYLRISAARAFLSLWVTSDNMRSLAYPYTTDRWSGLEAEYAKGELSETEWQGVAADRAAAIELQEAFKSYFGTNDFWQVPSLTPRELFHLVVTPHPPTSGRGKLLGALERFARHQEQSTTWGFLDLKNNKMRWNLEQPLRCKAELLFAERMEVVARSNAAAAKATKR